MALIPEDEALARPGAPPVAAGERVSVPGLDG